MVRQNNGVFRVTVAELANTGLAESAVIGHAIKTLSEGGEVKIDIPHRIYQVYGRQLSILGADGSRSTVAVFDYKGRLYQVEGKALPGGSAIDILRFQQSLIFTDGGSNRSPEAIRAIRKVAAARPMSATPQASTTHAAHRNENCAVFVVSGAYRGRRMARGYREHGLNWRGSSDGEK